METEEVFCPSAEDIERWMDSAFDMVGWVGPDRATAAGIHQPTHFTLK